MGTFTWFDGNQGAYRYFDPYRYDITKTTKKKIEAEYNGRDGDLDETRQPASYEITLKGAKTKTDGNGNTFYTKGTITKITWYDSDGDKKMEASGLSINLKQFWAALNEGSDWMFRHLLLKDDHSFVGADDGMNPDGWDGDDIDTGFGDDTITANGGDDYIKDQGGTDTYDGGDGYDALSYDQLFWRPWLGDQGIDADLAAGTVVGPDGNTDTLISIEMLRGTYLDDVMRGDGGDYNQFMGLQGNDTIDGRGGLDEVRYDRDDDQGGTNGVMVDLKKGTATDGFGDTDTLINIERVRGSDYDDLLIDNNGDNRLRGYDGDDTLCASKGDDQLEGGSGADLFQFKGKKFGDNSIWDFEVGTDQIEILKAKRFGQLDIEDNSDGDAVISYGKSTITLDGVSADDLSADDFLF